MHTELQAELHHDYVKKMKENVTQLAVSLADGVGGIGRDGGGGEEEEENAAAQNTVVVVTMSRHFPAGTVLAEGYPTVHHVDAYHTASWHYVPGGGLARAMCLINCSLSSTPHSCAHCCSPAQPRTEPEEEHVPDAPSPGPSLSPSNSEDKDVDPSLRQVSPTLPTL